jgi:hypothetical protein
VCLHLSKQTTTILIYTLIALKLFEVNIKIMKRLLSAFVLALSCLTAAAQTTVTIGSGTSTQGAPVSRFFRYHASEFIYLQSEINETGEIQSIAFDKRSGSDNNPIQSVQIYMKHTTDNSLASGTTSTVGYTLVYAGDFTNNAATGWMSVDLDTPFDYNNSDNLQVLIIKGNQNPLTSAQFPRFAYSSVTPNRFRSYSDDSNPWSTTRTLTSQTGPPNARMIIADACVQPEQPATACYETATWNASTCQWDITGTQPAEPTGLECWETASFNSVSCEWDVTGEQPQGTDDVAACDSYEWIDGNTYTESNSTATFTVVNGAANGCDSLVTLNLTIVEIDNSVTTNGLTLTANQSGATYQWIDCSDDSEIDWANSVSYTATGSGAFKVRITLGSCEEESICYNVNNASLSTSVFDNTRIYPNPFVDVIHMSGLPEGEKTIRVYTTIGQIVTEETTTDASKYLTLNNIAKGLYRIEIQLGEYKISRLLAHE